MAGKLFVFDLDDTLMMNQVQYDRAKIEAYEFLQTDLGATKAPSFGDFLNMLDSIDTEHIKSMGFSAERFPTSLSVLYNKVCERKKIGPVASVREKIKKIGKKVFSPKTYRKDLVPGAFETLEFLKSQNDTLVLFTKGDKKVQEAKVNALFGDTPREVFSGGIIITETSKTPEEFRKIAYNEACRRGKRFDLGEWTYSVGNSFKSDILPALETRYVRGIYLPYESWKYEMEDSEKHLEKWKEKVITLLDITDIKTQYGRL